jgi:hypothetical protein
VTRRVTHPRRRDGILAQEAQGRTVLLRPADGSYYALEGVGGRIWELCDGQRSIGEIAAVVSAEFDAPAGAIAADVGELVGELVGEGLLA